MRNISFLKIIVIIFFVFIIFSDFSTIKKKITIFLNKVKKKKTGKKGFEPLFLVLETNVLTRLNYFPKKNIND